MSRNRILWMIATVLLLSWILGAFVFAIGQAIHALLVMALAVVAIRFLLRSNTHDTP